MPVFRPDWLTSRPIAHRGLHNKEQRIIENSATAARLAIEQQCAIECDVQISADGEAIVFHDFTLERLTKAQGRVDSLDARALSALTLADSQDHPLPLSEFCALIGKRTPLICEIKSRFDGDMRLAERTAAIAKAYAGPMALKSFDPQIIAHLHKNRLPLGIRYLPLGVVAMADYGSQADEAEGDIHLDDQARYRLAHFLHYRESMPDFLSYCVQDMPNAVPFLCRYGIGLPVMAWTVKTEQDWANARQWADQAIFEGEIRR